MFFRKNWKLWAGGKKKCVFFFFFVIFEKIGKNWKLWAGNWKKVLFFTCFWHHKISHRADSDQYYFSKYLPSKFWNFVCHQDLASECQIFSAQKILACQCQIFAELKFWSPISEISLVPGFGISMSDFQYREIFGIPMPKCSGWKCDFMEKILDQKGTKFSGTRNLTSRCQKWSKMKKNIRGDPSSTKKKTLFFHLFSL